MSVAQHRLDQRRYDCLQPLATNAVRRLPQHDERFALGDAVNPAQQPWPPTLVGRTSTKHPHRVLAMVSRHHGKLVEDAGLLHPITDPVPLTYRRKKLVPR